MFATTNSKNPQIIANNREPRKLSGFDRLPVELLLNILPRLDDLATLDSLIRASPPCYRVFDRYAVEITEAVLNSGGLWTGKYFTSGYTCGHIRVLVCTTAAGPVRRPRGSRPSTSTRPPRRPCCAASSPRRAAWPGACSTASPSTWPASARWSPKELADPGCQRSPSASDRGVQAWQRIPLAGVGRNFEGRRDVGAPTWEEEQRVARAFWRLQLLVDLQRAAADIQKLRDGLDPQEVYGARMHRDRSVPYPTRQAPEFDEMNSVISYVQERYDVGDQGWWPPAAAVRSVEVRRWRPIPAPKGYDWRQLIYPSQGLRFLYNVYFRIQSIPSSPLFGIRMAWFQRYGVAFWSDERLCAYGLTSGRCIRGISTKTPSVPTWFSWQSILTSEGKDQVEKEHTKRMGGFAIWRRLRECDSESE